MKGSILRRWDDLGLDPGTVVLTFDDGPAGEGRTEALLDLLAQHRIRAGFCVIGRQVERHPDLCRRIRDAGHLLVNHSYAHTSPMALREAELTADMERCDAAIGSALGEPGYRSTWYRPPGGFLHQTLERVLVRTGRRLYPATFFAWDIFPFPGNRWRISTAIRNDLRRNRAGVYLLHEWIYPMLSAPGEIAPVPGNCPWLLPVIEELIAEVRNQGAAFADPSGLHVPGH